MDLSVSRRHFLRTTGAGFGALALHSMLSPLNAAGVALMSLHWAPKANSVFFCSCMEVLPSSTCLITNQNYS